MAEKEDLFKAVRAAYDNWIEAKKAFWKFEKALAQPTKGAEGLKIKLDAIKKEIKATESAIANLKKTLETLSKTANDLSNKKIITKEEWESAEISATLMRDSQTQMINVLDEAAKAVK